MFYQLLFVASYAALTTAGNVDSRRLQPGCPLLQGDTSCKVDIRPVRCEGCIYDNVCLAEAAGFELAGCTSLVIEMSEETEAPSGEPTKTGSFESTFLPTAGASGMTVDAIGCPPQNSDGVCGTIYLPVTCGDLKCEYDNQCLAELSGYGPEDCLSSSTTAAFTLSVDTVAPTEDREDDNDNCPPPSADGACADIFDPVECGDKKCVYGTQCLAILAGFLPDECMKPMIDADTAVPSDGGVPTVEEVSFETMVPTFEATMTSTEDADDGETLAPSKGENITGFAEVTNEDENGDAETMAPTEGATETPGEEGVGQTMNPGEVETISIPSTFSLTYYSGAPTDVDEDLTADEYVEIVTLLDKFYTAGFKADQGFTREFVSFAANITSMMYVPGGEPHVTFDFDAEFVFTEGSNITTADVLTKMENLDYYLFITEYLWQEPPLNQLDSVQEVTFAASTAEGGHGFGASEATEDEEPFMTQVPTMAVTSVVSHGEQFETGFGFATPMPTDTGSEPTTGSDLTLSDAVCSSDSPCGMCEGDCNMDSDCQEGLECFRRPGNEDSPVPGCPGTGIPGRDYCYVPSADQLRLRNVQCTIDEPCEACEGDCDTDMDCEDELACFQTHQGVGTKVPGCVGTVGTGLDFCYRVNAVGEKNLNSKQGSHVQLLRGTKHAT